MSILKFWLAIFCGSFMRLNFGGGGSTTQETKNAQTYNDSRTTAQYDNHALTDSGNSWSQWSATDSHATTDSGNVSNSGNTSTSNSGNTSSFAQWLASVTNTTTDSGNTTTADNHAITDSGNTSSLAQWFQANSDSHAVSNSGNTSTALTTTDSGNTSSFAQWLQSLTNSNNNTTTTTNNTDGRTTTTADSHNLASAYTDSHNLSSANSGNTSSVINYTGTDGGIGTIAGMVAQLFGAQSDSQAASLRSLATLGANVGNSAADLAMVSQANSMQLSTHMLDLTGELIDRLATGAAIGTATQLQTVRDTATAATAQNKASGDSTTKAAWIAGGLAVLAVILH